MATVVPRVVTGQQFVDYLLPLFTYAASGVAVSVALQYTDQELALFALVLLLYAILSAIKYFAEWLARANDGVVDGYERYVIYGIELVRWLLFFMLPTLVMSVLAWALGQAAPLPPWYEVLGLAAPVIAAVLAVLPVMLSAAANATLIAMAGGGGDM